MNNKFYENLEALGKRSEKVSGNLDVLLQLQECLKKDEFTKEDVCKMIELTDSLCQSAIFEATETEEEIYDLCKDNGVDADIRKDQSDKLADKIEYMLDNHAMLNKKKEKIKADEME